MKECDICGKWGQELTVFGEMVRFSLCKDHRNKYDSYVKRRDNSPDVQALITRLVRNDLEKNSLKILYTGRGPEYFRELTEKLLELQNETQELGDQVMELHKEAIAKIAINDNLLPPPHSLTEDHIEDH